MLLWRFLISSSNPYIVCSLEQWCLWNSLYCESRSLYNRSKFFTITPSQSLVDSSKSSSSSCSAIATIICRAQFLESVGCIYFTLASTLQHAMLGSLIMTSSSVLMLVARRSYVISNTKRSYTSYLGGRAGWFRIVASRSYKCGTFTVGCTTSESGVLFYVENFGSDNESKFGRFSYRPPPTISSNHHGWLSLGPLARGFNSDTLLSNISFKTESTTRSTSCLLIHSCNCSTSYKILHMSTLLIFPSTKDINMSLRFFCNCNLFWIYFKASSRNINCALMSASCCANATHFF